MLADLSTYKEVLLFAVLSGIAFFVGILNIETIIVFALIAAIFTFVQAVVKSPPVDLTCTSHWSTPSCSVSLSLAFSCLVLRIRGLVCLPILSALSFRTPCLSQPPYSSISCQTISKKGKNITTLPRS